MSNTTQPSRWTFDIWKHRLKAFFLRVRSLQGDPRYVAKGMAVGVFVAFTPTIPFHTVLTIALAFLLKGSKPAALIGAWLNNPLTFPAFYFGSYKLGVYILGHDIPENIRYDGIQEIMSLGWDVAASMIAGGVLLGILPAVGAYFLTYHLFLRIRARRSAGHATPGDTDGGHWDPQSRNRGTEDRNEDRELK